MPSCNSTRKTAGIADSFVCRCQNLRRKSEAFKAGYKTIAEISKERIRRAGKRFKPELMLKTKEKGELPLDDAEAVSRDRPRLQRSSNYGTAISNNGGRSKPVTLMPSSCRCRTSSTLLLPGGLD